MKIVSNQLFSAHVSFSYHMGTGIFPRWFKTSTISAEIFQEALLEELRKLNAIAVSDKHKYCRNSMLQQSTNICGMFLFLLCNLRA